MIELEDVFEPNYVVTYSLLLSTIDMEHVGTGAVHQFINNQKNQLFVQYKRLKREGMRVIKHPEFPKHIVLPPKIGEPVERLRITPSL